MGETKNGGTGRIGFFRSIRGKYALSLAAVILLLIGALWVVNHYFLERYYLRQKIGQMEEVRLEVERFIRNGEKEENEAALRRLCEAAAINAAIVRPGGAFNVIVFTNMDTDGGALNRLLASVGRRMPDALEVYREEENYSVYRVTDAVTGTFQIDCIGRLPAESGGHGDEIYVLTTPLAAVSEAADISNRFLLLIGLGTLVIGIGLTTLISWRLTRPVKELTELSARMAEMDFSERYQGHSGDELNILGQSLNEMADRLEENIEGLRRVNGQLEEDIREKELIDRKRKELLANISHELKTPIALIEGYSEGLRDGISEDPESRREYCDIILDEAGKMNTLVRQLLSLNELESGAVPLEISDFDLCEMLRGIARVFRVKAQEKQASLDLEMPESLPVRTDASLVEEVMRNYLNNALNHVEDHGEILIRAGVRDGEVRLAVFNTGSRIPEESLPEIWDKFYKVDPARTRSYGGSGIGLSIVKAATERLGGRCGAENRENGGEFFVTIPQK